MNFQLTEETRLERMWNVEVFQCQCCSSFFDLAHLGRVSLIRNLEIEVTFAVATQAHLELQSSEPINADSI